jgi:DNA-binding beta-propeller fold protein YncE
VGSILRKSRAALISCAALAMLAAAPSAASAAPTGAFVTDQNAAELAQFAISADQTLSFNGSANSDSGPADEAVTPNGKYLYEANDGIGGNGSGTTVNQYSIGPSGTLTPLSPATVVTGRGPVQIAVSPDGKNAYVANFLAPSVTEYSIASDGTLHLIGTLSSPSYNFPEGVAVSPDGASVYIADQESDEIFEYNRASDGTLTPKSTATVPYTAGYIPDPGFTPDGKYLYVVGNEGRIDEYSVGSGGELSPLATPSIPTGSEADGLVVSPNGHNVYSSSCTDDNVYEYSVNSGGQLAPLTTPTASTDGCGMPWMTASGTSFYVPDSNKSVYQFDVSLTTGSLSAKSPASVSDSGATSLLALVIPPDQGPVASFTDKTKGKTVQFNASKSSDSDGKVVSYHWDFGDGHSLTTGKAKVSHTYKKAAKHKVTLTVTDDSGCSTSLVFTGQTAYCNGTKAATTSHTVKLAATKSLKLRVSPNRAKAGQRTCYVFHATSSGHGVKGVSVRLAGRTTHSSSSGKAMLCLTLKKATYTARAHKSGYAAAAARIRVSAAAPVFTG